MRMPLLVYACRNAPGMLIVAMSKTDVIIMLLLEMVGGGSILLLVPWFSTLLASISISACMDMTVPFLNHEHEQ